MRCGWISLFFICHIDKTRVFHICHSVKHHWISVSHTCHFISISWPDSFIPDMFLASLKQSFISGIFISTNGCIYKHQWLQVFHIFHFINTEWPDSVISAMCVSTVYILQSVIPAMFINTIPQDFVYVPFLYNHHFTGVFHICYVYKQHCMQSFTPLSGVVGSQFIIRFMPHGLWLSSQGHVVERGWITVVLEAGVLSAVFLSE